MVYGHREKINRLYSSIARWVNASDQWLDSLEIKEEQIGNIAASSLLNCFLEEIGPSIYNKAVTDDQERMQINISELDIEFNEKEFPHSSKHERSTP